MDVTALLFGVIISVLIVLGGLFITASVVIAFATQNLKDGFNGTYLYLHRNGSTGQKAMFWTFTIGYAIMLTALLVLVHFQFYANFGIGNALSMFVFGLLTIFFGLVIVAFPGKSNLHKFYALCMLVFAIVYLGLMNPFLVVVPVIGTFILFFAYALGLQTSNWIAFSVLEYFVGGVIILELIAYFFYSEVI